MISINDLYTDNLKELYFEEVKKEFSRVIEEKNTRKIKWHRGDVSSLIDQCEKIIGIEKFNECFTGENAEEKFKQLVLMPPQKLDEISKIIQKRIDGGEIGKKDFEKEEIQRLKAVYTDGNIMGKKEGMRKINILLIKELGIIVCPYCNRNYINARGDKLGAQLDHFFSKDKYPIFAVSLYNFIPVCGVCNNIKRTTDFNVYPFLKDEENKHEVKFNYVLRGISEIEIYYVTSAEKRDDMEAINLKEAYSIHDFGIKNMLDREERYSQSYRQELRKLLVENAEIKNQDFRLSLMDDEIDCMIYGDVIFEKDIKNVSLGKFRQDIYKEIKALRK